MSPHLLWRPRRSGILKKSRVQRESCGDSLTETLHWGRLCRAENTSMKLPLSRTLFNTPPITFVSPAPFNVC